MTSKFETADMFADLATEPARRLRSLEKPQTVSGGRGANPTAETTSTNTATKKNTSSKKNSSSKKKRVDHMAAARRLRWKLRNAQSHSPEEVKAGRLICRHLLAMLEEASPAAQLTQPAQPAQVRYNAQGPHPSASQNDNFYAVPSTHY